MESSNGENQILVSESQKLNNSNLEPKHQELDDVVLPKKLSELLTISSEKSENLDSTVTDQPEKNDDSEVLQKLLKPHSQLPKPEPPPGIISMKNGTETKTEIKTETETENQSDNFPGVDMPAIGKYIKERSSSFSAAIAKKILTLKENNNSDEDVVKVRTEVSEFNLSGLRVIVKVKSEDNENQKVEREGIKGRISFFSRSNCRDCKAVRKLFREKGLRFVEINVDVFPQREKELFKRTGSLSVPQIFFNEKLFGGLVALNSLRNSGGFDQRLKEMLGTKCPDDAPSPPVYGFDDPDEEESTDEMIGIVRVLRQRLPIQDRLMKMKYVKNCFAGKEMVEVLIQHLDCGRKKAVEAAKQVSRKHFIHHVFGENDFEDGNHYYRFLEHEPFIPKCFNFRGSTNDGELKPAAKVGERLTKIMSAILEAYASDDRDHVDYIGISNSEEFRRYVNLAQDLQRTDLSELSPDEKLAFFLNLYNAMVIHAVIRVGHPESIMDRRFFSDFQYVVGGHPYSLSTIHNGILRNNRRPPYSLVKPFASEDKRLELAIGKVNPLIHFGLCNGTRSSPTVRFFTPEGVGVQLRSAAREFFESSGIEVDLDKRTVYLSKIVKWFSVDFGQEKEILKWIINFSEPTKAGLLTHILGDGGPINIVYKNYNWSLNC